MKKVYQMSLLSTTNDIYVTLNSWQCSLFFYHFNLNFTCRHCSIYCGLTRSVKIQNYKLYSWTNTTQADQVKNVGHKTSIGKVKLKVCLNRRWCEKVYSASYEDLLYIFLWRLQCDYQELSILQIYPCIKLDYFNNYLISVWLLSQESCTKGM